MSEIDLPTLDEDSAGGDPFALFAQWFADADRAAIPLYEAMALATATPDGRPSARMVLLRGFDERGFVFYTNYQSRKGKELAANPHVALVMHWELLRRQVRVEGCAELVSEEESDAYFQTRPFGSQLGALASPQSEVIADRAILDLRMKELSGQFTNNATRPPHWGGYRVVPTMIEFWQGCDDRLHDRFRFDRNAAGKWERVRLAP